ncbi:hypothetical protein DRP04_03895 [Archaeoglobales archaeon]|nr:MAG: hypothetical protein DRP04_03895 [Archaeoglobales archaeon]
MADEGSILPKPFYISGIPRKKERPKLFRPKELRELVFPEIGMIMYPLYWIKYALHLINLGYDISEQKYLFFWAEKEGETNPSESVLYYSLLSKFYSKQHGKKYLDVSVGRDWADKWLFKSEWGDKILNELDKFVRDPENFDFDSFVENIFSSDFKTECKNAGIILSRVIKNKMLSKFKISREESYSEIMKKAIEAFVRTIAEIFQENDELDIKEGAVVDPNINFTLKVLLQNSGGFNEQLSKLANNNFEFTKEEFKALLNVLQSTERGRFVLRSMLLLTYLDPLNNKNKTIIAKMRDIFEIYKRAKNFEETVTEKFGNFRFDQSVLNGLEESSFYWELNFFLVDGEEIARNLLENRNIIKESEIQRYFSEKNDEHVDYFKTFLIRLEDEKRRVCLTNLISKLKRKGERAIANYMEKLLEGVNKHHEPYIIFLNLLLEKKTLKKEVGKIYSVVAPPPKDVPSALFYGIEPLLDWLRVILKGIKSE